MQFFLYKICFENFLESDRMHENIFFFWIGESNLIVLRIFLNF